MRADIKTWGRAAIVSIRQRAKRIGVECTITANDIVVPEFCPVLGIRLQPALDGQRQKRASPSVDRKDNSKGYTPDNIRVISYRANELKRDASILELEAVLADMRKLHSPAEPASTEEGKAS
jgi:hypothetical protein